MADPVLPEPNEPARRLGKTGGALVAVTVALAAVHGGAIWLGLGGRAGINGPWPPWRDDHPLYFHSALVTGHFLARTGTTAGYDPAFMAGYPKSVVFPASSTLPELVLAVCGGSRPERAYKVYVLVGAAAVPWLVAAGAGLWRAGPGGACVAVALFLVYVWTDFPNNYVADGMVPYLLAVPLGLVAAGVFVRYCERGGWGWWLTSAVLMAGVVLVHFTSAMVVAPAAAVVYASALVENRGKGRAAFPGMRHLGVWLIPAVVLAVNAFWWLPGVWLASTKGPSGFAFTHKEGVLVRLGQIVTTEAPVERALCVAGLVGCAWQVRGGRTP